MSKLLDLLFAPDIKGWARQRDEDHDREQRDILAQSQRRIALALESLCSRRSPSSRDD